MIPNQLSLEPYLTKVGHDGKGCALQAGGALIGPHALGIIQDVEGVRHLAELGVVFLLFNIGLELSLERLRSMQKYVFGMGTAQVRLPYMFCVMSLDGHQDHHLCISYVLAWAPPRRGYQTSSHFRSKEECCADLLPCLCMHTLVVLCCGVFTFCLLAANLFAFGLPVCVSNDSQHQVLV